MNFRNTAKNVKEMILENFIFDGAAPLTKIRNYAFRSEIMLSDLKTKMQRIFTNGTTNSAAVTYGNSNMRRYNRVSSKIIVVCRIGVVNSIWF